MPDISETSTTRLFYITILCIILYVALDAIAQSLPPHYSPISQAESDLAIGNFGFIMTFNFLNRGFLSFTFIFAFLRTLDRFHIPRSQFRSSTALLGIWSIGALLLAVFPTDVPATPMSWHGAIHLAVALVAFIAGAFGTFLISRRLGENRELQGLKRLALPLSAIVVILWALEFCLPFVAPHLNLRIGGLTERLFLGSVLLWMGVVSFFLEGDVLPSKAVPTQAYA